MRIWSIFNFLAGLLCLLCAVINAVLGNFVMMLLSLGFMAWNFWLSQR